jgi:phosphoribosyl 1,2-cyclic phosphodiesterase
VTIGTPLEIGGASFNFFYSFHLIPCIGFEIEFKGKKIFFSADTYYDPAALKLKYEKGVFRKGRYEFLAFPNWDQYDTIFHEAGVPPTHTPLKILSALPESIRKKIYVVHTSAKDVTPETGLRIAPSGINNTIVVIPRSTGNTYERDLDLISGK